MQKEKDDGRILREYKDYNDFMVRKLQMFCAIELNS